VLVNVNEANIILNTTIPTTSSLMATITPIIATAAVIPGPVKC